MNNFQDYIDFLSLHKCTIVTVTSGLTPIICVVVVKLANFLVKCHNTGCCLYSVVEEFFHKVLECYQFAK